ncbi:dihydrolipoamide acetyltransferase family protein [Halobium salinum]|uniref:Dihydrolipoamide acetyltransferase family protein n=1 Tax=Halobium salinum TaxID=1364940 RepID=A0ABD5PFJ8_9EURY|nr:dihydrolipoamide acetyltransferase family protein [Halobium salinum]
MATKEFKLPDVGEGVAEGELVSWLVSPGDTVTEDQAVAEVETDKALVEVPSPYNGTVKELHVSEGEMVPVGDVIITYEVEGEAEDEPEVDVDDAEDAGEARADDAAETTDTAETETGETEQSSGKGGRVFAAPSARRLARELGVDIGSVDGSGPGGRVTEGDVRSAAEGDAESATADAGGAGDDAGPRSVEFSGKSATKRKGDAEQATNGQRAGGASTAEAAGRERTLAAPATRKLAEDEGVDLNDVPTDEARDGEAFVTQEAVLQYAEAQREAQQADAEAVQAEGETTEELVAADVEDDGAERVPYRGVRRTIGEQMAKSKYTAPHVTHHDSVVVDDLVDLREEMKGVAEERDAKLTYMPFIIKAVVAALKEYPYLNSTLDEEAGEIVLKDEYNIGIAVATDAGLMVPVVKECDRKSMLEIAREVSDLVERARNRKISREEMQGGTFTLTNFGAIGGEYATPIINFPEVGILGLGAIEERPAVRDGEVVAASTLPLSLSIDHRIVDGAVAAAFANTVMEYLDEPQLLLLDA